MIRVITKTPNEFIAMDTKTSTKITATRDSYKLESLLGSTSILLRHSTRASDELVGMAIAHFFGDAT